MYIEILTPMAFMTRHDLSLYFLYRCAQHQIFLSLESCGNSLQALIVVGIKLLLYSMMKIILKLGILYIS